MFRFPWGDFHSLNLGWFLQKFNELRNDWATAEAGIDGALDAEIQKAEDALTDVFAARDAAAASASAANSSALNASQSSLASMDARDQSRAARDAAQQAAGNAAASETAAGNSATAASNSAGAAATSATQAGQSATAAGNSATTAGNSATAAGNSATAAAGSATAAERSASDAEDAAASVEASAQQIETNKNDILDLKQSSAKKLLTPFDMWADRFLASSETTVRNRKIKLEKNHIMLTRLGNSTGGQGLSLLTGENFAIGETSMASIVYNADQYLPLDDFYPIKEYSDLYVNFGEYGTENEMGSNGIILQFVSIDENNNVTYISHGAVYAANNASYGYISTIKRPTEATHFGLFYITRRAIPGIPTDIVFTLNPHISDPVATSLALAT